MESLEWWLARKRIEWPVQLLSLYLLNFTHLEIIRPIHCNSLNLQCSANRVFCAWPCHGRAQAKSIVCSVRVYECICAYTILALRAYMNDPERWTIQLVRLVDPYLTLTLKCYISHFLTLMWHQPAAILTLIPYISHFLALMCYSTPTTLRTIRVHMTPG